MKQNKTSKRAVLTSALSLLLCCTMLIGTTWAWFTDSVTSAGNIIKSGTLDVEMTWADGTEDPNNTTWKDASAGAIFNNDLWEPGYVEVKHVKIANVGTLAFKYQIVIKANGELTKTADGKTLADAIDVYYLENATQVADRAALAAYTPECTLAQFLENNATANNTATGKLYPKDNTDSLPDNHTVTIALKMRESAGNEYQDMAIGTDFSVQLLATQWTYEEDTFDKNYDELADGTPDNADWPIDISTITVTDPTQPLVITAGNVTVTVPAAAIADGDKYELVVENISDELNFDTGYTDTAIEITLKKNETPVAATAGISYDVEVNMPNATAVNSVTHNGANVDTFTFAGGKLQFATDSFSPFEVSYLDKDTCIFAYDNSLTAEQNGAALTAYLNSVNDCKKNVFISAGTYVTNAQITFDGRPVNIIGLGDVTLTKGHDYHMFTLQDSTNPESTVVINMKNLTLDGNSRNRHVLNVKYNVTANLENMTIKNAGWSDILLDNANIYSGNAYYNDTRTVVNCKNVKVGKVSMDALPCTSTTQEYTTYAEFNYDSDSSVANIERQSINLGEDNLLVNGEVLKGNMTTVSTESALKTNITNAKDGDILVLDEDITVAEKWDERYGGKTNKSVTIDGKGHTLKLTGAVNDGGNYFSVFRFEGATVVKNMTFDMSEAQGTNNRLRAIAAKSDLIVDNCTFIGNPAVTNTRAIIFGEGQSAAQVNASVSITNCTFTNWRRGIGDNENGKDFKSVEIKDNKFTNAGVSVSAYENITFTGNEITGAGANFTSYSAGSTVTVTATGNTLDANYSDYNWISVNSDNTNVTAQGDLEVAFADVV